MPQPQRKGSIQDIVIKRENVRRAPPLYTPEKRDGESNTPPPQQPRRPVQYDQGGGKWYTNKWLILIIVLVILGGVFFALSLNKKVEISVTPKTQQVNVDFTARAGKNVAEAGDDISFTVFSIEDSRATTLPSNGVKEVDKRAEGRIIIFNNYSSEPQRLIARTRFETPDGKIFRISDAVVVPGVTVRDGESVPGSLEVTVRAEEPGAEYNVGFTDLTVPGLEGTPLFDDIFARTKTEIKGGFSGPVKVVDESAQNEKREELENELASVLLAQVEEQVSGGLISIQDGLFTSFSETLDDRAGNEEEDIPYTVTGTMHAILFDEGELAQLIAQEAGVEGVEDMSISIGDMSGLSILIEDKDLVTPTQDEVISITISGTARIVWDVPEEDVKNALAGKEKEESVYQAIFANQFPNIVEAQVISFKPFWGGNFPSDPSKIEIITQVPN